MEKKKWIIAGVTIFILTAFIIYWFFFRSMGYKLSDFNPSTDPCPGPNYSFPMQDRYLAGALDKGQMMTVSMNYYACNNLELGDIALLRFSNYSEPVARIVRALPGDRFHTAFDENKQKWMIVVNGKPVPDGAGGIYYYGTTDKPLLHQYQVTLKGKLSSDLVLLLCTTPPCRQDSTQFGLVSIKDILGKIEKGKNGRLVHFIKEPLPPLIQPKKKVEQEE